MATVGQKRKLEDTDIAINGDTPLKQQKLMSKDVKIENDEEIIKENKVNDDKVNEDKVKEEKIKNDKIKDDKIENKEDDDDMIDDKDKEKLREQIEFYFGDSNLMLDEYILNLSKENGGFFPITQLITFNNIQSITKNIDIIIKIIESSSKLELNKIKDGVRRHSSLPKPPSKEEIYSRTIFAKGFHPRMTLQQLTQFWQKQTDKPCQVKAVRQYKNKYQIGIDFKNQPKKVTRFFVCYYYYINYYYYIYPCAQINE